MTCLVFEAFKDKDVHQLSVFWHIQIAHEAIQTVKNISFSKQLV